jgi:hypothetical protein
MQKSVFYLLGKKSSECDLQHTKRKIFDCHSCGCFQSFIAPFVQTNRSTHFFVKNFCRKRYLNKSVSSNEVDGVLRVEELGVGQTLLPVVDKAGKLLIKKSGNSFCSLVISVFYSGQNID